MTRLTLVPAGDWRDDANCQGTDTDAFYPEKGGSTYEAKRVCAGCTVRRQCLEDAIDRGEQYGVWGGLSEHERRKMRRNQARQVAA